MLLGLEHREESLKASYLLLGNCGKLLSYVDRGAGGVGVYVIKRRAAYEGLVNYSLNTGNCVVAADESISLNVEELVAVELKQRSDSADERRLVSLALDNLVERKGGLAALYGDL